jgi:hypothetical protein
MRKGLGIELIPASAPEFFLEDTPTALVRQVLGAVAQFSKRRASGQSSRLLEIASGLGMANVRVDGHIRK